MRDLDPPAWSIYEDVEKDAMGAVVNSIGSGARGVDVVCDGLGSDGGA